MADEMSIASLIISIIILIVVIILIFIVCYYYNTNNNGNKNRFIVKDGDCNRVNEGCACTITNGTGVKTKTGVCIGVNSDRTVICDTYYKTTWCRNPN
uniref:Uncharacterized protein n=1 Tax=viral metagenome TaxID=1070528 RepID=A0A6C0I1F0_9ZZZZ